MLKENYDFHMFINTTNALKKFLCTQLFHTECLYIRKKSKHLHMHTHTHFRVHMTSLINYIQYLRNKINNPSFISTLSENIGKGHSSQLFGICITLKLGHCPTKREKCKSVSLIHKGAKIV